MDRAAILAQIRSHEITIANLNTKVRELERHLSDLDDLISGFIKAQRQFSEFQYEQDRVFLTMSSMAANIRFAFCHSNAMLELVRGQRAFHAGEGLSLAVKRIDDERVKTRDQLDGHKTQIQYHRRAVASLYGQLAYCLT